MEMNSIYGKFVLNLNNNTVTKLTLTADESIHVNHLSTPEVDTCVREILNTYFADWVVADLMEKFWSKAPLVLFENHTFLTLQMIQDIMIDVLNEYFTTKLIEDVIHDIYDRCDYERACNWADER